MTCTDKRPEPIDLFSLDDCRGIEQRLYATPLSTLHEILNCITKACASKKSVRLKKVPREIQTHVQMCIVTEEYHFEHDR
ncbi:hypothetical protein TNCV_4900791 [Trichonephila clavipes]|nr:hypothetical protein TNCV_4900791 [Trichonephila clavipes]